MVATAKSRVGNRRSGALRKRYRREMHDIADIQPGDIRHQFLGNVPRANPQFDIVTHDVEHAAAADAGRFLLVDEGDGYEKGDFRVGGNPEEIHMDRNIPHNVVLEVARNGAHLPALQLQVHERGEEPSSPDRAKEFALQELHVDGLLVPAIDDPGDVAGAPDGTRSTLAGGYPGFKRQCRRLGHGWRLSTLSVS